MMLLRGLKMFQKNSFSRSSTAVIRKSLILLMVILLATVAGCRKSALEKDYGNAWAYNEAVQIVNQGVPVDQTPAVGLSPRASVNVSGAYNDSFSGKKSSGGASTTINLGGLTTAGSGGGGSGGDK